MTEHDHSELQKAVHRAYDAIPTPPDLTAGVLDAVRSTSGTRHRVPQWAVGMAVAGVLAAIVGVATLPGRLGGSPSPPAAGGPAAVSTPTPTPTALPSEVPSESPRATAAPTPTPAPPTAAPRPTAPPVLPNGPGWQQQWAGTSKDLFGVDFVDRLHGWAVGASGTILQTADGGSTWNEERSGVTTDLTSVSFIDTKHGWAAGKADMMLVTSNGGTSWSLGHTGTGRQLNGVQFIDASQGWVVGGGLNDSGQLLQSADGGLHWKTVATPISVISARFADPQHGWVTDGFSIARTTDGGITWATVKTDAPSYNPWKVVRCGDQSHVYLASTGYVSSSSDGGATWQSTLMQPQALSGLDARGSYVWAVASLSTFAATYNTSTDGGLTWAGHQLGTPGTQGPLAVSAVDTSDAWLVGEGGLIVRLTG